jgi:hypothetical protein
MYNESPEGAPQLAGAEFIEKFLIELDYAYEKTGESTWVIHDEMDQIESIVLHYSAPILVFSVKLMPVPARNRELFFEELLKLNAEMVHGKYCIEDGFVMITDSLETENLDMNEFLASFDSLTLAITSHYKILKKYQ